MNQSTPPAQVNTLFIVWGALLFSILVYGGVLAFLISSADPEMASDDPELLQTLTLAFGLTALVTAGIAIYFRKDFTKKLEQGQFVESDNILELYFTPCIISWALSEAIAIYGFVLGLLSYEFIYFIAFAGPGFILMLAMRPQTRAIQEKADEIRKKKGADGPAEVKGTW